uniref:sterile alpha motif domain-containing protein 13 isoform X3 n=1 Tax=Jaculus jaculus TaxID=51337 RepID=UPI001E1B2936|nr:sterile alpha motif domain-containing protein 13 isoform X3 [Jaculus jaculus]
MFLVASSGGSKGTLQPSHGLCAHGEQGKWLCRCEKEIDGKSLLLMTRNDVLTGLQLKLGPALKIYEYHVKPLQTKHLKSSSS